MRLFIGLAINDALTKQLHSWVEAVSGTEWGQHVRWIPPYNYHLTLRFIGAKITEDKLLAIEQMMPNWFAEGMSAFDAEVLRIQRFPNKENGRFIVAALENTLLMQSLVDEIQRQLKPLGFSKPQQGFRPHITLGRLPKVAEAELAFPVTIDQPLENHWLEVTQLNLYQSVLTDHFPIYRQLASKPLETY